MPTGRIETYENSLVTLVNNYFDDTDLFLYEDDYIKLDLYVYSKSKMKLILDTLKFKDRGQAVDYPGVFPEKDTFTDGDVYVKYDDMDRIAFSKKYNAIIMYTQQKHHISILGLIEKPKYKKFNKVLSDILMTDNSSGYFANFDYKCKKGEYIEIADVMNESDRGVSIQKKTVDDEKLVFVKDSSIHNVMNDINLFFKKDTKDLYKKMNISYKRGAILYGNPGNGKTAMIREVIRKLKGVTIINIAPNTQRIPFIISELIAALDGHPALIIIEDIDAILSKFNRSEFLNILDGLNMKSGIYFIGTTNYPERIDPAFVNRSGRFDRMFEIGNPDENVRLEFFRNSNIEEILSGYKTHKAKSTNDGLSVVGLFVKYSDGLSMANLKELMISTKYMLISDDSKSVEECLESVANTLKTTKEEHVASHDAYTKPLRPIYGTTRRDVYDDEF